MHDIHNDLTSRMTRQTAVRTAVEVARDWAIEETGNTPQTLDRVTHYMANWMLRNSGSMWVMQDIIGAVWALAELDEGADPLTFVDEDWPGTVTEALDYLRNGYERDLQHALNRITWKDVR